MEYKWGKVLGAVCLFLFVIAVNPGWGQPEEPAPPEPEDYSHGALAGYRRGGQGLTPEQWEKRQQILDQWKELDPRTKEVIAERFREYRRLPPKEQQRLRNNWKQFQALPPEERERIRVRHEEWRKLSPEQKDRMRRRWERFEKLSPEQKQVIRERRLLWQQLSPERRKELRRRFRGHPERLRWEKRRR